MSSATRPPLTSPNSSTTSPSPSTTNNFAQIQHHYQNLERQLHDESFSNEAQLELFEPPNWPF